jgi:hypothetical protein
MSRLLQSTAILALVSLSASAIAQTLHGTLYKDPNCPCCEGHVGYLAKHGVELEVKPVDNLEEISKDAGVPPDFRGCHTILLDGYVVEGHVKIDIIQELLKERPADVVGISMPSMPTGVPGMGGPYQGPYDVFAIHKDGSTTVFATQ